MLGVGEVGEAVHEDSPHLLERAVGAARTCTVLGVEYFIGDVPAATTTVLRRVESGLVRSYALWIAVGAAGLLLYLVIWAGR